MIGGIPHNGKGPGQLERRFDVDLWLGKHPEFDEAAYQAYLQSIREEMGVTKNEAGWHRCERCQAPVWASIDRWPIVLCEKCAMRETFFNVFGWFLRHSLALILVLTGLACVFEAVYLSWK